jgi:F-type H+-transporting ATPase subunit b
MSETATAPAETTETTEAHGGEHGGAKFPPLDTKTFGSQLLWLAVFFGLLYLLMSKWVLPRITAILEGRARHIENDLATAKSLQEQTAAAVQSYEKALAEARGNAQSIAQTTRTTLQGEVDAERSSLEEALAKKISAAEAKIASTKAKAMAEVGSVASDSAAAIVEQLTGIKITKTAAAKAVSGKA